jgi:hypothetical protein
LKFDINTFKKLSENCVRKGKLVQKSLLDLIEYLKSIKKEDEVKSKEIKHATLVPVIELDNEVQPNTSNNNCSTSATQSELINRVNKVLSDEEKRAKINLIKYNNAMSEYAERIREFEDKDLTLDELDSDRSSYIIEGKMKDRFNKLKIEYFKLATKYPHLIEETNSSQENINSIKQTLHKSKKIFQLNFKFTYTSYKDLNEIFEENFSKLKQFPEYSDIYELVEKSNEDLKLGLNENECRSIGTDVFKKIGNILKQKRETYDRECLLSRFNELLEDPLKDDDELNAVLLKHKTEADEKKKKIIDEFAMKQLNEIVSDEEDDDLVTIESENEDVIILD